MNGRNRHLQYRNSVYRRRRIRTVLITVGVLLGVLLVAFLIIGNILHNKSVERQGERTETTAEVTAAPTPVEKTAKEISAYAAHIETAEVGSFADRVAALPNGGAAVSIPLTDGAGGLLYASPLAQRLGLQSAESYTVTLAAALASVGERYSSGIFSLPALLEEDALLRSVRLAQSAAILAEAAEAGLDEVVLTVPDMTEAQVDELLHFVGEVRHLAPDLTVGLAVSAAIRQSENAAALLDRLYEGLDLLAIEASAGEGDAAAQIEALITDAGMRYNLLRYHMRLLFPSANADGQAALIAVAEKEGFRNWQFVG